MKNQYASSVNFAKNRFKNYLTGVFLFLFLATNSVFYAQQKDIEEHYLEYFKLPREALFLHTNKTAYLTSESIWFKVYAYDRKNGLFSKKTRNIYFGLYDENGQQLQKKLYRSKEGAAIGSFELDSTLASGDYYLKVATNWMKNFKEDDSYVQKIQIINPKKSADNQPKIYTKEYDFQFLPEGGHILIGVKNSVGIKAIDDTGKGVAASGIIYNSKGAEIVRFKSNFLGIGKFSFTPKKGETYKANISLENGKEFEQSLPKFHQIGVGVSVDNQLDDKTVITFRLNEASWNQLRNKTFKLLLHKDGNVKTIPVNFDDATHQIVIAKKDLYPGVNTITLFNENEQPIVERMFFNAQGAVKNYDFYLSSTGADQDTLYYRLRTNNPLGNQLLNASISVLPTETVSYNPDHNIVSAFHLKPYVRGTIENPQYYFKDFNRRKQFELDALLLTQGWSRYSWDRIFNLPPKPSFDFENGISINGFVNRNLEDVSQLFLYETNQNASAFINIDEEGRFNLKNFFPEANEDIRFSYIDKRGKMKKPGMSLSYVNYMGTDNVNTSDHQNFQSYYQDKNQIPENFIIDDSYEKLNEIVIETDYKEKLRRETRDPILTNGRVTKIGKDEIERYPFIFDLIQQKGFDVVASPAAGRVQIFARTRGNNRVVPTVFLDGVMINGSLDVLYNMTTEQVESIVTDPTGIGLGLSGGFGGAIKINLRKTVYTSERKAINTTIYTNTSQFGFQPVKEFYTPKYASYRLQSFKDYGIIHWEPNLIFSNLSEEIRIVDTGLDEITFYIEGMSSDGTVFSQQITLDNSTKN
jgi:hypothetical protein